MSENILKMELPKGEKLQANKPLLLSMLEHLKNEGEKSPLKAQSTAQTLLLEYIADKDILSLYWEVLDMVEPPIREAFRAGELHKYCEKS